VRAPPRAEDLDVGPWPPSWDQKQPTWRQPRAVDAATINSNGVRTAAPIACLVPPDARRFRSGSWLTVGLDLLAGAPHSQ
jgi:hypothetical protein